MVVVNDSKHIFGICLGCLNVFDLRVTGLFTYIYIYIYIYMYTCPSVWWSVGGGGVRGVGD